MTKILVVDDNDLNREIIMRRLMKRGFEVETATDGEEAIAKVRSIAPDLVVMDMTMPVLDGYETARLLKDDAKTAKIPIIGLSAHVMVGDREKAIDAGCNDYESKPVDINSLVTKIQALLGLS